MDVICTLTDPRGINGWGEAGFGLDGAVRHRLEPSASKENVEGGRTTIFKGVPLDAEPGHECYLYDVG